MLTGYPGRPVLDLTAVRFVSSEGIGSLVDAAHRAAAAGSRLSIITSAPVRRRLDQLGLTQILTVTSAADPPTVPDTCTPAPGPW